LRDEFKKINGLKLVNFSKRGKFDIKVYFRIAKFIRDNRIDIVQAFVSNHHAYIPSFLAGRSIPLGGIRSTYSNDKSFFDGILRFKLARLSSKSKKMCLISNSYAGRDIYVQRGFPEDEIFVIPNGIDVDRFLKGNRQKIIKEFGLKNKLVLGMVARIDEKKNHEELIRIFYDLQKDFKNIVLLIVGDGPHLPKLKRITEDLSLGSKVIFTGLRKDIPDFLAAMDIFVFPSKFPEGWPNVVGEAMCAGLPVVSYPCGDVSRIIRDRYDGIITEPDEIAFKKKLISLIKNPASRMQLGSNAKKTISNKFTIPIMVKNYEKVYLELIKR